MEAFEPKFIELVTKGVNFICNLRYLVGGGGGGGGGVQSWCCMI